jgi:chromate transporter
VLRGIFLGAPFIEHLRKNRRLSEALSAITAAIVGVVLNLALWFGIYTLFGQVRDVYLFGGQCPCRCGHRWTGSRRRRL